MAEIKTDCFAYSKKRGCCMALKETYCRHEETCSFYKSREEFEANLKKYPTKAGGKK